MGDAGALAFPNLPDRWFLQPGRRASTPDAPRSPSYCMRTACMGAAAGPPSVHRGSWAPAGVALICVRSGDVGHRRTPGNHDPWKDSSQKSLPPALTPPQCVVGAPAAPPETRPISASVLAFPGAQLFSPQHGSFVNRWYLSAGIRVCVRSTPAGMAEADHGAQPTSVCQQRDHPKGGECAAGASPRRPPLRRALSVWPTASGAVESADGTGG